MQKVLVFLLLLSALAGCLGDDGGADDGPTTDPGTGTDGLPGDPMPAGDGHDHADPAQHRMAWNYALAAADPLATSSTDYAGLHALDLRGDLLFGAVYGSHTASANGGLQIWDVSDPASPARLGSLLIPGSVGGDRSMEATPDGDFVVLSTEPLTCLGQVNPLGAIQAYLIDVSDPSLPLVTDVQSVTGQTLGSVDNLAPGQGQHSVTVERIGDDDYAFLWGEIYRIDRSAPTGATLVYQATIDVGHDLYIKHAPDGRALGLAANGNRGLVVWDLSDPADPQQLAQWDIPGRDELPYSHYIHTADGLFHDDGFLVVVTSEDWEDHVSPYWVLNATAMLDGGEGELLGAWSNPSGRTAEGLTFSQHNPRFHDGLMTLAHYHGGVWQFDFRDSASWSDPAVIAYALHAPDLAPTLRDPAEEQVQSAACGINEELAVPSYFDIEVDEDGTVYAADVTTGLHVFAPTAEHPLYGTT